MIKAQTTMPIMSRPKTPLRACLCSTKTGFRPLSETLAAAERARPAHERRRNRTPEKRLARLSSVIGHAIRSKGGAPLLKRLPAGRRHWSNFRLTYTPLYSPLCIAIAHRISPRAARWAPPWRSSIATSLKPWQSPDAERVALCARR